MFHYFTNELDSDVMYSMHNPHEFELWSSRIDVIYDYSVSLHPAAVSRPRCTASVEGLSQ